MLGKVGKWIHYKANTAALISPSVFASYKLANAPDSLTPENQSLFPSTLLMRVRVTPLTDSAPVDLDPNIGTPLNMPHCYFPQGDVILLT